MNFRFLQQQEDERKKYFYRISPPVSSPFSMNLSHLEVPPMFHAICLCLFLVFPFSGAFAMPEKNAEEIVSSLADQTAVAVTIYNQDLALVRDSRKLTLQPGQQTLAFREVSAQIRPQTALLAAPELRVLEQNF
ncbi:MAG: hypothetical protein D3908_09510, partial [Candidatus Electrothrix sp. AUS4]|nr:hypothetical protein [Candidatus Electrothrix sp. AUS4]